MILYFSGTGNSRYVAEKIADELNDDTLSLNDKIKNNDNETITADYIVVVTPTYAWRIPRIVSELLTKTELCGVKKAWFVMTCGGEIGNADKYNRRLCAQKGISYMGTAQILMPENYIALFGTPNTEEARRIVSASENDIKNAIEKIKSDAPFEKVKNNLYYSLLSGAVNDVFYPMFVKSKAFYADGKCISCGKCVKLCPLNNIALVDKKPVWGNDCTHCMACINYCPTEAIEYGKNSIGKVRYTFEILKI